MVESCWPRATSVSPLVTASLVLVVWMLKARNVFNCMCYKQTTSSLHFSTAPSNIYISLMLTVAFQYSMICWLPYRKAESRVTLELDSVKIFQNELFI